MSGLCSGGAQMLCFLWSRVHWVDWLSLLQWPSWTTQPEPSECSSTQYPAPFASSHSYTPDCGHHDYGKISPMKCCGAQILSMSRTRATLLAIAQTELQRRLDISWWPDGWPHLALWHLLNIHTRPSCSISAPLSGLGCWLWWKEVEHTLKGNRACSDINLWASVPVSSDMTQLLGSEGHPTEEKPQLIPVSGSSPSISRPAPYLGDSFQYTLEKDVTLAHIRFSSLNKPSGHTQDV